LSTAGVIEAGSFSLLSYCFSFSYCERVAQIIKQNQIKRRRQKTKQSWPVQSGASHHQCTARVCLYNMSVWSSLIHWSEIMTPRYANDTMEK
jgi:hypothetical protein